MGELTLLIRADADVAMGTGHVMRCLALAQAWQDERGRAVFVMSDPAPWMRQRLGKESVELLEMPASVGTPADAAQTSSLAREHAATWVAVDGYQFGADYQRALKSSGAKTLFLDDYGHADYYCADVVLNQNISAAEGLYQNREPYTQLLLGTDYCLLRREFSQWQAWKRESASIGHRVLVTMGGSDPQNFTERVIRALNLIADETLEAAVVVGGSNLRFDVLQRIAGEAGKKIEVHRDVSNMAELMAWSDVAVSAAGTTCWEMCLLGLPAMLIDLADNQTPLAQELHRRGCAIHLGRPAEISAENLSLQVQNLLRSSTARQAMTSRCRALVDGNGARRVVAALRDVKLRLRPAQENDRRLLWEWANDSRVREASFSSEGIPWEAHVAWFKERLHDSGCRIYVAENEDGTPIGQVRFDMRANQDFEIDISIANEWRGHGLAVPLIRQAVSSVFDGERCGRLHAFIKPDNVASVKAFEKGGFKRVSIDKVRGNEAIHFIYEAKKSRQK